MNIINLLTLCVGFLAPIGPLIVFFRDRYSKKNKLLLVLSIAIGPLWAISIVLFLSTNDVIIQRISANIIYTLSISDAVLAYFFTKSFSYKKEIKLYEKVVLYIPAIFFLFEVWFTDNFILSITDSTPQFGILYLLWVTWFALVIGACIFLVTKHIQGISVNEIEKKQSGYLRAGLIISGLGLAPTNVILPYFGIYEYIWAGPIMTLFMMIILSYAVSTIRFYNLKTIFKSISSFFVSNILPSLIIGAISMLLLGVNVSIGYWLLLSLISFISFLFINFFRTKLFKKKDPSSTLLEKMSTVLELDDIGKEIIDLMTEVLNAKQIEMYVIDEKKRSIFKSSDKEFLQESDFPVSEILSYSFSDKVEDRIVVIQELKYLQMSSENNGIQREEALSLIRYMDKHGIQVIVPISLRGGYLAFIILSDKRGGEMYSADDLRFISKIKSDIKVLLERSLLYEEVAEFNSVLQQKVDEQTKELQIKVKELEEARRKENDMIDIMGHELRTPATVVKLNAEMLRKYIDRNPKEYAKYLERISKAIDTEIGLINTLLTSAKLEGNKVEIRREKVDIKESIEMSVHGNEKDLKEGVKIYTDIEKGLPFAYADRIRVMEVLDNLISNAVKYTDKGRIDIQARSKGEYIEISVKDTGKGIPKEDISKLGSKFYRANNYLESKIVRPGGTGLGLYVTFRLVKLMGGKINVESEEGKGSTFTFTLPRYTNQKVDSTDTVDKFTKLGLK